MPALRKKENCRNWFACFTLPSGRRVQRSTGTSDRKKAEKLAIQFEEATRKARTSRQAQRVIRDIYAEMTGEALQSRTLRKYVQEWTGRKKGEVGDNTLKSYTSKIGQLVDFLGAKADSDIALISSQDILEFRKTAADRVSARTVNNGIKIIRILFEDAKRDGLVAENPAKEVKVLKSETFCDRRAFTTDEIKSILAVADDEWRSMVLFSLYTGQRMGDICMLCWENIDFSTKHVRLVTRKTRRTIGVPFCPALEAHIAKLPAVRQAKDPLHPRAFALYQKAGKSGTVSRQFASVLSKAGLRGKTDHSKRGDGRTGRRKTEPLTYHCLRHSAVSFMINAGISPEVVIEVVGFDSREIMRLYTHIDSAAKKTAVDALPDITQ